MKNKLKIGFISMKEDEGCPPAGLVYMCTYLKKQLGGNIEARIIDRNFDKVDSVIRSERFDLLGISAMTVEYGSALELARQIKKDIDVPIIVGGVHISTLPSSFENCFDAGVIGEGEEAIFELSKIYLERGALRKEDLSGIKGIVFNDAGKLVKTQERELIEKLDDIPPVDWSLLNKRYFFRRPLTTWGEFGIEGNILTSRGCPYKCRFCSTSAFWKKMRFHSPEYVVGQIEDLVLNYKVTHIQIWDDLFTINIPRLTKIAELLKKKNLTEKVKFNCQPRPNLLNDELCKILKEINVKILIFGFESGSDKTLNFLKHGTVTVEDNKNAILCCRRNGLKVQGSVVFASPGETLEEMRKTVDFIDFTIKNGAQRIWSFVLTPFPDTEIWEIAKQRGKVRDNGFDWSLLSHQKAGKPLLLDDDIKLEDFQKLFSIAKNKLKRFKYGKMFSFILNNPFRTLLYAIGNPFTSLYLLFTKKDV